MRSDGSVVASSVNAPTPAARLARVNKWFKEFHVLRDIDLEIAAGERVVLWGPSGSGKTTLLRCLAGLEPAQTGTIEIVGERKAVGPLVRATPTRRVGMVFQQSALFLHLRVIDNLTIGLTAVRGLSKAAAEEVALAALARVRMRDYARHYPRQLSGGQQQRAEIARALCMEPMLLLFDEPTAALDPELKNEVRETIAELAADGRTIVVATHEEHLVRGLDPRMVLMAEGAIVGESRAAQFFTGGAT
jgi:ABC-type polar amino acid transport system ATPase subunit